MKKRAFTLIELLVVIAIIAILAAILFPVFAQAKLAAKKSAALSNIKQVTLANLMYENDYDDYFVLMSQDFYDDGCGVAANSGTSHCLKGLTNPTLDWPLLLQPYIKSLGLFVDPATGDPQGYFGGGPNALPANQNSGAQFGYNFTALSPILILDQSSGGWLPTSFGFQFAGAGRSQTQAARPGDTVMFAGADHGPENFSSHTLSAGAQLSTPDSDAAVPPGVGAQLYYATNRLVLVCTDSKVANWASDWVKNTPVGELTGCTRALGPYTGAVTGFVDGHAKVMTADALAAGTDFGTSTTTSGGGFGSIVTDVTKFMWSLDGTLRDYGQSPQFP